MTVQDCIDASLRLLNQYSIAGELIPTTYNDQEDDIKRMIPLINDAMMEIATNARPISAYAEFTVEANPDTRIVEDVEFTMPSDFDRCLEIYFKPSIGADRTFRESNNYKWVDDETILFPSNVSGTYRVSYMRFPEQYSPAMTAQQRAATYLDNTPDTHNLIPYYVAAVIAEQDDNKAYYNLYNLWETKLSRLGYKPPHATMHPVVDEYNFF